MYTNNYAIQQLIAGSIVVGVAFAAMFAYTNVDEHRIDSTLTPIQNELRSLVRNERKKELIHLLKETKTDAEIFELADAVSSNANDVSYSLLQDGPKQTIMFYHSHTTFGYQPVAGIVLPR